MSLAVYSTLRKLSKLSVTSFQPPLDLMFPQGRSREVQREQMEIGCSRYARALGMNAKVAGSPNEINLLGFRCSLYVYSLARMRVDRHKFIIFRHLVRGTQRLDQRNFPFRVFVY